MIDTIRDYILSLLRQDAEKTYIRANSILQVGICLKHKKYTKDVASRKYFEMGNHREDVPDHPHQSIRYSPPFQFDPRSR